MRIVTGWRGIIGHDKIRRYLPLSIADEQFEITEQAIAAIRVEQGCVYGRNLWYLAQCQP